MTRSNRLRASPAQPITADLDALTELVEILGEVARTLPGDDPASLESISQWQDGDFQRRYRMLEIDLMGIRALAGRSRDDESLQAAVNYRLGVMKTALSELIINTLGYQALPDPEPLLIDNEGPIGHHQALGLMRALRDYFEPGREQDGFELKSTIARKVLES